jgi:hypothetical protein
LHERIAAEVKAQLEAKGKSTEGVETFEEFYGLLQSEAVMLQKKYQPQLRNGIKIAVDLVNSVKEDAKDGDVDVRIAPNDTVEELRVVYENTTNSGAFKLHPGTFSQHETDSGGKIYNSSGEEKQIHLLAKHSSGVDVEARVNPDHVYLQFSKFRDKLIDNPVDGKGKGLNQKIDQANKGIISFTTKKGRYPQKTAEYDNKIQEQRDKIIEYKDRVDYLETIGKQDGDKIQAICEDERYYKIAFSSTKFKSTEIMYESILKALDNRSSEIDEQLTKVNGDSLVPKDVGTTTRKPIRYTLAHNIGVGYELNSNMEVNEITRPITTVAITLIVSDNKPDQPLYKVYTAYPEA